MIVVLLLSNLLPIFYFFIITQKRRIVYSYTGTDTAFNRYVLAIYLKC